MNTTLQMNVRLAVSSIVRPGLTAGSRPRNLVVVMQGLTRQISAKPSLTDCRPKSLCPGSQMQRAASDASALRAEQEEIRARRILDRAKSGGIFARMAFRALRARDGPRNQDIHARMGRICALVRPDADQG